MKYFLLAALSVCLFGCTHFEHVEFTGNIGGVNDGVFVIKDLKGQTIYGENIKDGKFHIESKVLEIPGYYTMDLVDEADRNETHPGFEIYLQDGKYTIDAKAGQLSNYPKVTAPSAIQQQLTSYYMLADNMNSDLNKQLNILNTKIRSKETDKLPRDQFTALLNSYTEMGLKKGDVMSKALDEYVTKNPQNTIGAHVMLRQDFDRDPLLFNKIFKKLTPAVQNTEDGKAIGERLSRLVKLVPGQPAPAIAGKLLDGRAFNPASLHKKLFIIDFWRAGNEIARRNHKEIPAMLVSLGKDNVGVISVSMETKADWWSSAVKEDGMTWTQVSDLKGDDSPNTANWSITRLPRYDLVDGSWHMVERDVMFNQIYYAAQAYLKKH